MVGPKSHNHPDDPQKLLRMSCKGAPIYKFFYSNTDESIGTYISASNRTPQEILQVKHHARRGGLA
jgi:hypothetical protein